MKPISMQKLECPTQPTQTNGRPLRGGKTNQFNSYHLNGLCKHLYNFQVY